MCWLPTGAKVVLKHSINLRRGVGRQGNRTRIAANLGHFCSPYLYGKENHVWFCSPYPYGKENHMWFCSPYLYGKENHVWF